MKFIVHFVPWRPASGDWDALKEGYADSVLARLDEAFLPGLRARIVARSVQSPLDYQRRIVQWFGHYLKGEPAQPWITSGVSFLDREQELKKAKSGKGS